MSLGHECLGPLRIRFRVKVGPDDNADLVGARALQVLMYLEPELEQGYPGVPDTRYRASAAQVVRSGNRIRSQHDLFDTLRAGVAQEGAAAAQLVAGLYIGLRRRHVVEP